MTEETKYNPQIHRRRSIRLKGYDYALAGAYFITLCTYHHENLFGEIAGGKMHLNELGQILQEEWEKSAEIRAEIELDEWVIMPNHFHGIVFIHDMGDSGRGDRPVACTGMDANVATGPARKSIGALMSGFKSAATIQINIHRRTPRVPVWQRNYWETIIRDEQSYHAIMAYIRDNPFNWESDALHG
jgi:putative transposase